MPKKCNYLGIRFTKLLVVAAAPNTKSGASAWWCVCDCGKAAVYARSTDLRRGDSQSCGCTTGALISAANTTHGMSRTRVYKCWRAMHDRCYNSNTENYHLYGARGIRVCKRWFSFPAFYADMGDRGMGLSLERRNNMRGYSPSNCYWATHAQQQVNKRNNRMLVFNGERKALAQWAQQYSQPPLRVWQRLDRGWSVERALTTPLRGKVLHLQSLAM